MTWRYSIYAEPDGHGGDTYHVCEVYAEDGHTSGIQACGDTPEQLLADLRRMVEDVKAAIERNEVFR